MLFNSYAFIFVFLPVAIIGFQLASVFGRRVIIAWLGMISLVFYACWRPELVLLLLGSISANYLGAYLISNSRGDPARSRVCMWAAICLNLVVLGYFKYFFPVLNFWGSALDHPMHWTGVILPLGISFFTFTQIAYLVDLHQGTAELQDPFSYLLFVTFFPHLIAGPILHHQEMMPQFQRPRARGLQSTDVAVGLSWFIMGLGKKVVLADHLADPVNVIFGMHELVPAQMAWRGVLGYALQLYFDFSGYSDMALGLARIFSIDFPLNFSSPYKSTSMIDFWQRWHITLSRYITTYVYTPIQVAVSAHRQATGKKVSRKALATPEGFASMIAFPMLLTMLIAGVWHGAGLQYVVFGLLHGTYLAVNHGWRLVRHNRPKTDGQLARGGMRVIARRIGCVALTLSCVLVAQVFFRADSTSHALSILAGLIGLHGFGLSSLLPDESPSKLVQHVLMIVLGFIIVWAFPNTQQILGRFKPSLEKTVWDVEISRASLLWFPSIRWAFLMSCLSLAALVGLQNPSTFLYFQF